MTTPEQEEAELEEKTLRQNIGREGDQQAALKEHKSHVNHEAKP
jgi:hypothetical protein